MARRIHRRTVTKREPSIAAAAAAVLVAIALIIAYRWLQEVDAAHDAFLPLMISSNLFILSAPVASAFVPSFSINLHRRSQSESSTLSMISSEIRKEGGAESVGLQPGLGADAQQMAMSSILDDGKGHINAELAQSIWEWGEYW